MRENGRSQIKNRGRSRARPGCHPPSLPPSLPPSPLRTREVVQLVVAVQVDLVRLLADGGALFQLLVDAGPAGGGQEGDEPRGERDNKKK